MIENSSFVRFVVLLLFIFVIALVSADSNTVVTEVDTNDLWEIWIVTPCYKQEKTVFATIKSVIDQDYVRWKLIVVDDGSVDRSCFKATEAAFKTLKISNSTANVIWQQNAGLSLTRHSGLSYMKQKFTTSSDRVFLCFLDADDKIRPDYFSTAVSYLRQAPDIELLYADQFLTSLDAGNELIWDVPVLNVETAVKSGPLPVMSLIRLDLYQRVGGFSPLLVEGNEDYSFWLSCLELGVKSQKLPIVGSDYYIKPNSMMRTGSYKAVALPMLKIMHPGLYSNSELGNALNEIVCKMRTEQADKIEKILEHGSSSEYCMGYLWSWLYHLRNSNAKSSSFLYYLGNNEKNSLKTKKSLQKLQNCLNANEQRVDNYWTVYSSNLLAKVLMNYLTTNEFRFNSLFCEKEEQSFEDIFDSNGAQLAMLRVLSMFGTYVAESRSRSILSNYMIDPFQLVIINDNVNDVESNLFLDFANKLPSVKPLIFLISGENDFKKLPPVNFRDIQRIDGLYFNLHGYEQPLINFMFNRQILSQVGFVATEFNRKLLDRNGPSPATEFIMRSFGDLGYSMIVAEQGNRLDFDHIITSVLASAITVKLIMRLPNFRENPATNLISKSLSVVAPPTSQPIPCIVHFIFGMAETESERLFSMHHYLAVKAAYDILRPQVIYLYYAHEPWGYWWNFTKPMITETKVRNVDNIFGNPVQHFAHKADIIRLEALLNHGGIYLDLDVWVYKDNIRGLLNGEHDFVMGQEGYNGAVGLCNGIIIAKKDSKFLRIWYDEYRQFNAKNWNKFSVVLPKKLAAQYPSLIHVVAHTAFFWPLWDSNGLGRLYLQMDCPWFQMGYAVHLWASKATSFMQELGSSALYQYETCFFQLARHIYFNIPISCQYKPHGNRCPKKVSALITPPMTKQSYVEETANPSYRTEMQDIAVGIAVYSIGSLETARRTWVNIARKFGIHCVFYTSNPSLVNDYHLLQKKSYRKTKQTNAWTPLVLLAYPNQTLLNSIDSSKMSRNVRDPNSSINQWLSFHMLVHLYQTRNAQTERGDDPQPTRRRFTRQFKWFVKVEADTFLRPDALRSMRCPLIRESIFI